MGCGLWVSGPNGFDFAGSLPLGFEFAACLEFSLLGT